MTARPERYAIGMDVGGTSVRSGLVSARGRLRRGSRRQCAVDSQGPAEPILDVFADAIKENLRRVRSENLDLVGIGIGMCGPLDYDEGIVLMQGLDKYDALYGMNLKTALRKRIGLPRDFPITMEPDSWAFARGEAWLGAGRGFRRILAITLGTGFGSAFVADGKLLGDGPGVPPPFGWIGSLPFRGRLLDDVISRRGIRNLYRQLAGPAADSGADVREIAENARRGDVVCRETFEAFGQLMGAAIAPILRQFQAECLIFGGRISLAFDLFEEGLRCGLESIPKLRRIALAHSFSNAAIQGAAKLAFLSARRA